MRKKLPDSAPSTSAVSFCRGDCSGGPSWGEDALVASVTGVLRDEDIVVYIVRLSVGFDVTEIG